MADLVDDVVTALGGLAAFIPAVVVGALAITLFFWGVPKLIGLFKRTAR